MSRRLSYSDTFNGEADKGIRAILESHEGEGKTAKLKRTLLNIIKNELTARQSEIIMLYYFKGMDMVQIAKMLGISPQSVSKTMSRAKVKIYNILRYYFS